MPPFKSKVANIPLPSSLPITEKKKKTPGLSGSTASQCFILLLRPRLFILFYFFFFSNPTLIRSRVNDFRNENFICISTTFPQTLQGLDLSCRYSRHLEYIKTRRKNWKIFCFLRNGRLRTSSATNVNNFI